MKKVVRKNKTSIIQDLNEAQKLAFAPLAFQALATMLDFGIIEFLDNNPFSSEEQISENLDLDEYTVRTLLQVGEANKIIQKNDNLFSLTKMGKLFLYDDMTQANFNYVKDVCYLGASELKNSFKNRQPMGLKKFIGDYPTIYPVIPDLPERMKQSWYEFDHHYSDNCFEEIFSIITKKYHSIFDIGGNTGKFEKFCLNHIEDIDITMLDLKINTDNLKNNKDFKNCKFCPINVLDEKPNYPKFENCGILMSQFLDCFSKKDIKKILKDLKINMDDKSSVYILEPYTDMQKFEGAKYSLIHTSLYFTCMANGVSKMYSLKEMKELLSESGFKIAEQYEGIGSYDYTLLECIKDAVVSN